MVFNKIDAYMYQKKDEDDLSEKKQENLSLDELKNSWMARNNAPAVFISAIQKYNVNELKDKLYHFVKEIHILRYPYNDFLY
jgi:GTP-binding protein HflX